MNKKFLFVLLLVFLGTYKAEVRATGERNFVAELASLEEGVAPDFVKRPKNVVVEEGAFVSIDARAVGVPTPIFEVYKDGVRIYPSVEISISVMLGLITVTINDVHLEDEGEYLIKAINAYGRVSVSCYVTVKARE